MKKIFLSSLLFLLFVHSQYGQTITLTFTAIDSTTQDVIGLDSVRIDNLTLGCDTTVFGTSPTLVLPVFVGIHENNPGGNLSLQVMQNIPNPFRGLTVVTIFLPTRGKLKLALSDVMGNMLAKYENNFEAGFNKFEITSNCPGFLLLNAYNDKEIRSIKLINISEGSGSNNIKYLGSEIGIEKGSLKSSSVLTDSGFIFYLGDQLQCTASAIGYNNSIIQDSPIDDTTYLFPMSITTLAIVSTASVTNITQTTASGGGNVISDGGFPVTARGICWSISPNPTTADNFTIDGSGLGIFVSYLTGLTPNTPYYVRAYAVNSDGTTYGNQVTFLTLPDGTLATVTTAAITEITQTTATSGGNVTSDGGSQVTSRGVCWSTSQNPTIANSHTVDGSGLGTFVSYLTGLSPNTQYYVRAYATNTVGTAYGNEIPFITGQNITIPTVTTSDVTDITQTTATSGGNVLSDGGSPVTSSGVCWNTLPNPTTGNSYTVDGSGLGTYVSYLTGLTQNTQYYVRAYATNSVGIAYGNEVTFTTDSSVCNGITTVTYEGQTYNTVEIGSQCWLKENLNIGTRINASQNQTDNGVIEKYCYNDLEINCNVYGGLYQWNEMMNYCTGEGVHGICPPGWHVPTAVEFDTLGNACGGQTVAGGPLKEAGYIHWSYPNTGATNSSGFTGLPGGRCIKIDGTNVQYAELTTSGNFWNSTHTARILNYLSFDFSYGGDHPWDPRFYSVRCIKGFGPDTATLTTITVTNIAVFTATSGGNITSDGGAAVTARGVCWSTSPSPTTAGNHTSNGTGTGTFISNITGLTASTLYYVRAYATNIAETAYGNELTFTTMNYPTITTNAITYITDTTATSGGNVTSDGGLTITAKGVCWNTLTNPTISDSHTVDGSGLGTFVSSLTGLTPNTLYYIRSYVTNFGGTFYGNELTFVTLPPPQPCPGSPTVTYEGKTYNTVQIGTQCWFKENLNVGTRINGSQSQTNNGVKEKYCNLDIESNCDLYGGLYQWDEMMQYVTAQGVQGLCPSGWHIPTSSEWSSLDNFLGGNAVSGGKIKAAGISDWSTPNAGATNISGFTALPGGEYLGSYGGIHHSAYFWTSTQYNSSDATEYDFYYNTPYTDVSSALKIYGFSVRCIKN